MIEIKDKSAISALWRITHKKTDTKLKDSFNHKLFSRKGPWFYTTDLLCELRTLMPFCKIYYSMCSSLKSWKVPRMASMPVTLALLSAVPSQNNKPSCPESAAPGRECIEIAAVAGAGFQGLAGERKTIVCVGVCTSWLERSATRLYQELL